MKKKNEKSTVEAEAMHPRHVEQGAFFYMSAAMCLTPRLTRAIPGKYNILFYFFCGFGEKARLFNPSPARNMHINTTLIHNSSFKTWWFKRKASARSIKRIFSPQPLS